MTTAQTYSPRRPPIFSLAERGRRWALVRELMRERGLEGLLVAGFRAREMYETYISDDYNEGCVIFPYDGDPVVITWAYLRVMRARWSKERGNTLWVDDYRVATSGMGVAEVFREKRLGEANLGVVGLRSQAPTEIYGAIPANFWEELTTALPKTRWTDISEEFSQLMLVKERRGAGAGPLRGARGGSRLQGDRRGHGAGRRRGSRLCRSDARDAAPRHRPALPGDRHEFGTAYVVLGTAALDDER